MQQHSFRKVDLIPEILKWVILLSIVGVLAYKLITTQIQLTIDLPIILSLLLALFSIYLSAMFYFKATETSNSFYDNTYKFTKDIAELLVRIESGFGERLKHLDENYTRIQDKFERYSHPEEVEQAQKEAEKSKVELDQKEKERESLIQDLVNRAKLQGEERENMLQRLSKTEKELINAQQQLSMYQNELARVKTSRYHEKTLEESIESAMRYLRAIIIPELDPSFLARAPLTLIHRRWKSLLDKLPPAFIADLQRTDFIDDENRLTNKGIGYLQREARRMIETNANEAEKLQ